MSERSLPASLCALLRDYRRLLNALAATVCFGGLVFAYYAQFYQGLEPCPLCIVQRLVLLAVGLVFLAAALHNPRTWGAKVYALLISLVALAGVGVSGRHVWLQHLPPEQAPRCGPGLDYMLETLPLNETLHEILSGSGECAEVTWRLFGVSIPIWMLLMFLALALAGLVINWQRRCDKLA